MKHIVIHECFGSIGFLGDGPNCLNKNQLDELDAYCQSRGFDERFLEWGKSSLRFYNYVGFIQLSDVSIEILPKVDFVTVGDVNVDDSRRVLLHMLRRSGFVDVSFSELSLLNYTHQNLFEIFASLFVSKLEKELVRGAYAEYVQREDNLSVVRGAIMVQSQIRNIATGVPMVFCRFEEHSQDNTLNHLFKQVIQSLLRHVTHMTTIRQLNRCLHYFPEVSNSLPSVSEVDRIHFTRINQRFESSFILAKMLYRNLSSLPQRGQSKGFSIVFRMDQVFERYIGSLLYETIGTRVKLQSNEARLMVSEKTQRDIFQLIPDIIIDSGDTQRLIIDTKWKRISPSQNRHGASREDLFQMYAYITRYANVGRAVLLYPYHSGIGDLPGKAIESWYLENQTDKKIRMYSVDLSSEDKTNESLFSVLQDNGVKL